jgi:hypothetical protein
MQGSRIDAVGLDDIVSWVLKYAQKSEQSSTLAVTLGGYIKKIGPSVLCIDACRFENNISFYWCSLFGRAVSGTMPKSRAFKAEAQLADARKPIEDFEARIRALTTKL